MLPGSSRWRGPRPRRGPGSRPRASASSPSAPPCTDYDRAYFHAYSHVGVHEEMLKDHVRTETYRKAIMKYQSSIEGKVVLDVGCGTGILSIFCALAGAKRFCSNWHTRRPHEMPVFWYLRIAVADRLVMRIYSETSTNFRDPKVYAVEASEIAVQMALTVKQLTHDYPQMLHQATEVVKANNLSHKIIVLLGRVEDVCIEEKVDVIVSEWMGYMLIYESMLASIIFARDKWLKCEGLILPSHATLYMAPVTHPGRYEESVAFWRNIYGINMSPMLPLAKQCAFEEPSIETIKGENILTWPSVVLYVDCYTVVVQELQSITAKYKFSSMMAAPLHGFAFWFDVEFNGPAASSEDVQSPIESPASCHSKKPVEENEALVLSTAPEDAPTHWQQTLIYLYNPLDVGKGETIEGSVALSQSKENPRFLNILLEYTSGGRAFVKESVLR